MGATRDTEPTIRITAQACGCVGALRYRGSFILLLNPGGDVRDVEGNDLAKTRNLFLEGVNSASQQIGKQPAIELVELLAKPEARRESVLDVEAVGLGEIEDKMEAQFDDEQRVCDEKVASLGGGDEALADADEEGFEGSSFGMAGAASWRLLAFPLLDDGPIECGEKSAVVGDNGIMIEQSGESGLVKDARSRYQSMGLLLLMCRLFMNTLHMEFLFCQGLLPSFSGKRSMRDK